MSDDEYGPALPPGFAQKKPASIPVAGPQLPSNQKRDCDKDIKDSSSGNQTSIGPMLPPHLRDDNADLTRVMGPAIPPKSSVSKNVSSSDEETIGPKIPPHLRSTYVRDISNNESSDEETSIGPKLPPHLNNKQNLSNNRDRNIGPQLPYHLIGKSSEHIGPSLPSASYEQNEDIIGPLPCEMSKRDDAGMAAAEFESRAQRMRDKLQGKEKTEEKIGRESWMTELPSDKLSQSIGLQARSFRAKAKPDMSDRAGWTDTPADRERKSKEEVSKKRTYGEIGQSDRDKQLSKDVKKYNKSNRAESLLDMHQKELKKKKKATEEKPAERRPFDREVDLQVNRFDDAQRQAIIKKSQKLDSRFSHGHSQFL